MKGLTYTTDHLFKATCSVIHYAGNLISGPIQIITNGVVIIGCIIGAFFIFYYCRPCFRTVALLCLPLCRPRLLLRRRHQNDTESPTASSVLVPLPKYPTIDLYLAEVTSAPPRGQPPVVSSHNLEICKENVQSLDSSSTFSKFLTAALNPLVKENLPNQSHPKFLVVNECCPTIDVALYNHQNPCFQLQTQAILDTGSEISLIKEDIAKHLHLEIIANSSQVITQAGGDQSSTLGAAWIGFKLPSHDPHLTNPEILQVHVVKSSPVSFLVGTDYLKRYKTTTFYWKNGLVNVGDKEIPMTCSFPNESYRGVARLCSTCVIPPRSAKFASVDIGPFYDKFPELVFEPDKSQSAKHGILISSSLNKPENSKIDISILNPRFQPITLYLGTRLGKVGVYRSSAKHTTLSMTAESVAKVLVNKVLLQHGAPKEILSDQGTSFLANVISEICLFFETRKINTAAFHPQTDGLVERFNKTLATMLSLYLNSSQTDWDFYLPFLTFAYNCSTQASSQFLPFSLLYG